MDILPIKVSGKRGQPHDEPELLAACYRSSLLLADEVAAESVAFPAISTGVYGYPKEPAATIAVEAIRSATTDVQRVILVVFDQANWDAYTAALAS